MANDINIVVLVGRITRDPEMTYTRGGTALLKLSIAVNRGKKIGDKWENEASFFDVTIWGKLAESLNKYLVKGKQIAVQGELQQQRWTQDGANRSRVTINARSIQMLADARGSSERNTNNQGDKSYQDRNSTTQRESSEPKPHDEFTDFQGTQTTKEDYNGPEFFDSDIPF